MGDDSTAPARRTLRPWFAAAIVAALFTVGAVVLAGLTAGSPRLTVGLILLLMAATAAALRRLATPG